MDASSLEELAFRYRFYLLAAGVGILLILSGIVLTTKQLPDFSGDKVEILSAQDETGKTQALVVEIAGAVEKPGVYTVAPNSRIDDMLVLAGGLSAKADREWVGRTLNRAAKITDGQKLFIPEISQNLKLKTSEASGLVNINTAGQSQLEELPSIGPATAKKIIEQRPYSAVEELITRKIIKKNQYEQIKDKISVH